MGDAKAGIAQVLDKLFETMGKGRDSSETSDLANVLPKPQTQVIGDGFITWTWFADDIKIEGIFATRNNNDLFLKKDEYVVYVSMPEHANYSYSFLGERGKEFGQAVLSAYNWQHIWKMHAGDFLLQDLSKEPAKQMVAIESVEEEEPVQG